MPFRDIARVMGRDPKVPVGVKSAKEVAGRLSWLARFVSKDNPVSSQRARELLGAGAAIPI